MVDDVTEGGFDFVRVEAGNMVMVEANAGIESEERYYPLKGAFDFLTITPDNKYAVIELLDWGSPVFVHYSQIEGLFAQVFAEQENVGKSIKEAVRQALADFRTFGVLPPQPGPT
jgi:hypothetical protein